MSSFQGVGIEGFHCIQKCPHFRRVGIEEFRTEVSSFLVVGIEEFQRCPHLRGLGQRGSTINESNPII